MGSLEDTLAKARGQAEAGKLKAAERSLWEIIGQARFNPIAARGILAVAETVRNGATGGFKDDCDRLVAVASRTVVLADNGGIEPEAEGSPRKGAIAVVASCKVIGASGFADLPIGTACEVIFRPDEVVLLRLSDLCEVATPWSGLGLEIGGAGAIRSGGGFIGGGFGLAGAAVGMLTASALNSITTKTGIDTVLHMQTPDAELFLHHDQVPPEALRRALSPVFTKLRQAESAGPEMNAGGDHVIDRLHKLADLRDRGVVTEEEFSRLKADLLA
jgi:hypothetical protein